MRAMVYLAMNRHSRQLEYGDFQQIVVHTWPDENEEETGRIISARKATRHERKVYEEGEF